VDRRRLRSTDDIERNGLVGVAAEATDFKIDAFRASPNAGDGCAGPLYPSIRWFQAMQASWSASLRASAARSAECRIELP